MKKKIKKAIAAFSLSCMILSTVNVFATNQEFSFKFTKKDQKKNAQAYRKEDNEQNAYVTVKSGLKSGDVFGCRVRLYGVGSPMTDYTLISDFKKHRIPYTISVCKGYNNYLVGQIDSTSSRSSYTVSGLWIP